MRKWSSPSKDPQLEESSQEYNTITHLKKLDGIVHRSSQKVSNRKSQVFHVHGPEEQKEPGFNTETFNAYFSAFGEPRARGLQ